LGLASVGEIAEFEQLLPHYPELMEVLSEFEYRLELFSLDNEEPPPPELKEKVEARIRELPVIRQMPREEGAKQSRPGYITVEATNPYIKVHKHWRTFLIVIFILSKILLAFSIYYFLEYRHARKELLQLEQREK
jgi:hypothetical protein